MAIIKKIIGGSESPFKEPFYGKAHGVEKNKAGGAGHFLSLVYPTYFQSLKEDPIKLLEIGIYEGNSLRMWRDYFRKGLIFGIDIDKSRKFTEDRIETFIGNQSDTKFLAKLPFPFDIIIDDGSHISPDQISSYKFLFPKLNPGGLYIIEDLGLSYHPAWGEEQYSSGGRNAPGTIMEYLKSLADSVVLSELQIDYIHFYKNIAILRKKED